MSFELYTLIEDIKESQMSLYHTFSKQEIEGKLKRIRELEGLKRQS